jgi:hypothetical protein
MRDGAAGQRGGRGRRAWSWVGRSGGGADATAMARGRVLVPSMGGGISFVGRAIKTRPVATASATTRISDVCPPFACRGESAVPDGGPTWIRAAHFGQIPSVNSTRTPRQLVTRSSLAWP